MAILCCPTSRKDSDIHHPCRPGNESLSVCMDAINEDVEMKKTHFYSLAIALLLVISAPMRAYSFFFTPKEISLVRDSVFNNDASVTYGQIYDSYKYFEDQDWDVITDERGRDVVVFKATYPAKFIVLSILEKFDCEDKESIAESIAEKLENIKIDIEEHFIISADGRSFRHRPAMVTFSTEEKPEQFLLTGMLHANRPFALAVVPKAILKSASYEVVKHFSKDIEQIEGVDTFQWKAFVPDGKRPLYIWKVEKVLLDDSSKQASLILKTQVTDILREEFIEDNDIFSKVDIQDLKKKSYTVLQEYSYPVTEILFWRSDNEFGAAHQAKYNYSLNLNKKTLYASIPVVSEDLQKKLITIEEDYKRQQQEKADAERRQYEEEKEQAARRVLEQMGIASNIDAVWQERLGSYSNQNNDLFTIYESDEEGKHYHINVATITLNNEPCVLGGECVRDRNDSNALICTVSSDSGERNISVRYKNNTFAFFDVNDSIKGLCKAPVAEKHKTFSRKLPQDCTARVLAKKKIVGTLLGIDYGDAAYPVIQLQDGSEVSLMCGEDQAEEFFGTKPGQKVEAVYEDTQFLYNPDGSEEGGFCHRANLCVSGRIVQ